MKRRANTAKSRGLRARPSRPSRPPTSTRFNSGSENKLPVRFTLSRARANRVFLAGSFNQWRPDVTPMKKAGGDFWTVEVPLQPGRHEYRFLVDGAWVDDLAAARFSPAPIGGLNAVIHV